MGIETAFFIGVLVGQWIMLWVQWLAVMRLVRLLTYLPVKVNEQPSQNDPLANSLPAGTDDDDPSDYL
jgi:hypothetical protein